MSLASVIEAKKTNTNNRLVIEKDLIRKHYNKIKESDAILVLNFDKKG